MQERGRMQLVNAINGYQFVLKTLRDKEKFSWKDVIGINKDERGNPRYYIVLEDFGVNNIFIKFSREFYTSGMGGYRESINVDGGLRECLKHDVKRVFFVYPDGTIYWTKFNDPDDEDSFMNKAVLRITNNENKKLYSILIKDLKRY